MCHMTYRSFPTLGYGACSSASNKNISLFFENCVEAVYVRLSPMAVKMGNMQGHHVPGPKNTLIP